MTNDLKTHIKNCNDHFERFKDKTYKSHDTKILALIYNDYDDGHYYNGKEYTLYYQNNNKIYELADTYQGVTLNERNLEDVKKALKDTYAHENISGKTSGYGNAYWNYRTVLIDTTDNKEINNPFNSPTATFISHSKNSSTTTFQNNSKPNRFSNYDRVPKIYKRYDGDYICNSISIMDFLAREGLLASKKGENILCISHNEKNPSMQINAYSNRNSNYAQRTGRETCHCYTCQYTGDIIGMTQKLRGYSFNEACNYLVSDYGLNDSLAISNFDEWKDAQDEIARRIKIKELNEEGKHDEAKELAKQSGSFVKSTTYDFSIERFPMEVKDAELIHLKAFNNTIQQSLEEQYEFVPIKEGMALGKFSPEEIKKYTQENYNMFTDDDRDFVVVETPLYIEKENGKFAETNCISIPSMKDLWEDAINMNNDCYERYCIEETILSYADEALIDAVDERKELIKSWTNLRKQIPTEAEYAELKRIYTLYNQYENDKDVKNGVKPHPILEGREKKLFFKAMLIGDIEELGKNARNKIESITALKERIESLRNGRGSEWKSRMVDRSTEEDSSVNELTKFKENHMQYKEELNEQIKRIRNQNKEYARFCKIAHDKKALSSEKNKVNISFTAKV